MAKRARDAAIALLESHPIKKLPDKTMAELERLRREAEREITAKHMK